MEKVLSELGVKKIARIRYSSKIPSLTYGNRLVSSYALLIPNKEAKSRLRGIKQKKFQIIPLNLDLALLFRISEA